MTRSRRGASLPPIKLRLTILLLVMTLAFVGIGARLVELQTRDQSHLRSLGVGQRLRTVTLAAERGSIFDRNGVDLALSVPQTTIVADPSVIRDPAAYAAKLAPVVEAACLIEPAIFARVGSTPAVAFNVSTDMFLVPRSSRNDRAACAKIAISA